MQWLVKIVLVYVLVSGSLAQSSSEICADAPDMSYVASLENCSWYYQCILNVAHRLACSFGNFNI